ncbi:MAG: glycoside hydrolase family 16 protein [Bacteroidetes bacterium]|nr:glycoside hydrolase family 16 protein [Bacteroidota bacterium]
MMKLIIFILILLSCSEQKNEPDWSLVWSDEFNYTGLPDTSKWGNEVGFIRNNELQYYTKQRLDNSKVENGNLLIIGKKESYINANYTSASLVTDRKHSWTYGKIDARIKLPKGQGMWPAFWMLGQNIHQVGWPKCGEIDIMEHINNEDLLHGTLHWYNEKHVSSGGTTPCDVTQYHNYTVEWDKEAVKCFLDGNKYWEVSIKDSINSTAEFHKPHYIILNLAIGGNWPKNPDATTLFPDTMYVDYVRVYQNVTK